MLFRSIAVKGDREHPANYGRLCVKGTALHERLGEQGRLLKPRVDGQEVSWEQALTTTGAQTEEIKKAIQGFTAAHNALTAKIPPANAYDKPIAGLKQAIDDLTASNKGINARLIDMQQAQVARDQAPPPVVEKPKVEAAKPQPKRTPAVASGRDALIRYP